MTPPAGSSSTPTCRSRTPSARSSRPSAAPAPQRQLRCFREQGLLFRRRLSSGAAQGRGGRGTTDAHPSSPALSRTPGYTGAFVYGRTQTTRAPGGRELARRQLPREQWHTIILVGTVPVDGP